ncbi:HD domain-containing protein [Streptomyces sp. KS 21]|uniref:HD domain-containing protein n=1 Tax=Streptomyces sp. KS 21 TaxID=2485150 RepID=UPI0010639FEB|nr:HD domain-containing protein [Streptomyces sp. KS 21]TDU76018.1 HD domain-containing protein [Streptomyces sp. KS 21]
MADDLSAVARFLYEAGTLKHTRRTGWWMAGVNDSESVAEHSWRWIDNSRARLTTGTGRRLADEVLAQGPLDWLRNALGEKA